MAVCLIVFSNSLMSFGNQSCRFLCQASYCHAACLAASLDRFTAPASGIRVFLGGFAVAEGGFAVAEEVLV